MFTLSFLSRSVDYTLNSAKLAHSLNTSKFTAFISRSTTEAVQTRFIVLHQSLWTGVIIRYSKFLHLCNTEQNSTEPQLGKVTA